MNPNHYPLRMRSDRRAKQARCVCGWEGPWRSTPPTHHRSADSHRRREIAWQDFLLHEEQVSQREAG